MPKDVHDCVNKLKAKEDFYPGDPDRESIAWGICWKNKKRKQAKAGAELYRLAQALDDAGEHEAADVVDELAQDAPHTGAEQLSQSMDTLRNALEALNLRLTGQNRDGQRQRPIDDKEMYEVLLSNREYYLSDGGYSRLVLRLVAPNYETYDVQLTSNSTDRAKAEWDQAQSERQGVEAAANNVYQCLLAQENSPL
ncbi:MAG: hypothetical protein JSS66_07040 [Armatimonadetes bacterium]|nr:hypothetical protein [Armatimonadota bacterium]